MARTVTSEHVDDFAHPTSDTPRIVIATDFHDAAVPLTLMRAHAAILGRETPAEIVLAIPGEPTDEDANSAQILLAEAGHGSLRSVRLESFATAASQPCKIALVPRGDLSTLLAEMGDAIVRLHEIALRGAQDTVSVPAGSLARHLEAFSPVAVD